MLVRLGKIWTLFEDGISLAADQKLCRMINRHGPIAKVELEEISHEALDRALRQAESGKVIMGM